MKFYMHQNHNFYYYEAKIISKYKIKGEKMMKQNKRKQNEKMKVKNILQN